MSNRILIAVGNKSRSGKDTFADYLVENYNFVKLSFAEPIYTICEAIQRSACKPVIKNPALLVLIGTELKKIYGSNIWTDIVAQKIKSLPDANIIVSDTRLNTDMDMLKSLGFIIIKINRPDRPIDRDPNHPTEIELDNRVDFDYIVENNSTLEEYKEKIKSLVESL